MCPKAESVPRGRAGGGYLEGGGGGKPEEALKPPNKADTLIVGRGRFPGPRAGGRGSGVSEGGTDGQRAGHEVRHTRMRNAVGVAASGGNLVFFSGEW